MMAELDPPHSDVLWFTTIEDKKLVAKRMPLCEIMDGDHLELFLFKNRATGKMVELNRETFIKQIEYELGHKEKVFDVYIQKAFSELPDEIISKFKI